MTGTPEVATRHFYRNRFSNLVVWLIAVFAVDLLLVQGAREVRDGGPVLLVCLDFVLAAAFLVAVLRVPFHGVVATAQGVRIRNVWRTHVLRWDEVERFESGVYAPWPWAGIAVLRNGHRIPIVGIQRGAIGRSTEKAVAALNERLAAARAAD
jgi:hypothetical protein